MQRLIVLIICLLPAFIPGNAVAATEGSEEAPLLTASAVPNGTGSAGGGAAARSPEALLEFGIEERVRLEDFDNTGEFSSAIEDVQRRLRFRTKIWTRWTPNSSVEFYFRLGNEFKRTIEPALKWKCSAPDEGFIDNAYIDFKKLFVPGMSLKIGRQDLTKGEGFLLTDYTAGDGSRSTYMNGFDLAYSIRKSTLHLLGIAATKKDHFLPRINDSARATNDNDSSLLGLYFETKARRNTDIDAYWLYVSEVRDYREATVAAFMPDRHLSTIGTRLSHNLSKSLNVTGEFAYQAGRQHANLARLMPTASVRAWGGYGYIRKNFERSWNPSVQVGEYLYSGDQDETDDRATGFDPLFGKWPARSELLSYGMMKEKGYGYFSNMRITHLQFGFSPLKQIKNTISYERVDAFHSNEASNPQVFGSGTHRGDLFVVKSEVTLNQNWKGHFQYETMLPGNFYLGHDNAHFLRVEFMYTFSKALLKH